MLDHKNQNKPPFSLLQGFLKWKLKTDYFGTKSIAEKLALNQNISLSVALWRMKKIAFQMKYDRSIGKVKRVAAFLRVVHNVITLNNQKQ